MSAEGQSFDQLISQARLLRQRGENKKAIASYQQALTLNPEAADALNEMGLAHIHIGEQFEAITAFDRAIDIQAHEPTGHSNKVEAYLTVGDFAGALAAAEKGLFAIPESAQLWVKKARALESFLKIPEAIEAYNESLRHDSDNPETWKALALCLDAQEKWSEVARAYRIAAALHRKRGEYRDSESCSKFASMAEKTV